MLHDRHAAHRRPDCEFPQQYAKFPNRPGPGCLLEQNPLRRKPSVNGFWNEVSYGQTTATGDVYGRFTLSQSYDCTTTTAMQTAAIAAAVGTVDFTQYNRIVIVFPVSSCSFGGSGDLGCQSASSTINHQYSVVGLPISSWYETEDDVEPRDGAPPAAH